MSLYHKFCAECRASVHFEATQEDFSSVLQSLGWAGGWYSDGFLCPECQKTCRIVSYPTGEYNSTSVIKITKDGIECDDILMNLDWEWIDRVRAELGAVTDAPKMSVTDFIATNTLRQ